MVSKSVPIVSSTSDRVSITLARLHSVQLCSRLAVVCLIVVSSAATSRGQVNWPQFRGADARGVGLSPDLPVRWSAAENVEWKAELPGRGWSSPVVWGERVFLTTVVNTGEAEEPKKGLYFGGNRPDPPKAMHQWIVLCLQLSTGELLWEQRVHEGVPESSIHLKNSFASETPVTDGQRVYCYFGNLGVFCFDMEGNSVWQRTLKPHKTRFGWGTAASPVIHNGRLYLVNDNDDDSYLLALDAETGNEIWRRSRDEASNWSTPFVWANDVRTEIVTPGTEQVRSYDLDGNLLWWLEGMSSITIATPYAADGVLVVSSGYVGDPERPLYAIRPGASGDITLSDDELSSEFIAWSLPKAAPYNPTTLTYQGRLYVLYDRGLVACMKLDDGTELYGRERLPKGAGFTSSPWAYGEHIFCLNEDGVTFVIKAGDDFELVGTNSLGDDQMCMATPAIAGDRLLIRTDAGLYCLREQ